MGLKQLFCRGKHFPGLVENSHIFQISQWNILVIFGGKCLKFMVMSCRCFSEECLQRRLLIGESFLWVISLKIPPKSGRYVHQRQATGVFGTIYLGGLILLAVDMAKYQATRPYEHMCSLLAAEWKRVLSGLWWRPKWVQVFL